MFHLVSAATRRLFSAEHRAGSSVVRAAHAYVYLRWIHEYVHIARTYLIPYLPRGLRRWLQNNYHAKVVTPAEAEQIVTFEGQIDLHDISDQVVPYPAIRDLVLKERPNVAVLECACRASRRDEEGVCCTPSQVCMIMGQPFVDFAIDKHKTRAEPRITAAGDQGFMRAGWRDWGGVLELTPEQATEFLRDRHREGRVHTAWFKDATMGRFYAICNCCTCCCSGIKAMTEWDTHVLAPSGYVSVIDPERCEGCGTCVTACIFHALERPPGSAVPTHAMDRHGEFTCFGCGVCVSACPHGAIRLELPPNPRVLPMDVRLLEAAHGKTLAKAGVTEEVDDATIREILAKMGVRPEDEADFRARYHLPPQPPRRVD